MSNINRYLKSLPEKQLIEMASEIRSGYAPANGPTKKFNKLINRKIDNGEVAINPTQYRRIYLPTLSKLILAECTDRYLHAWLIGKLYLEGTSDEDKTKANNTLKASSLGDM
jgi:hypothetical protein